MINIKNNIINMEKFLEKLTSILKEVFRMKTDYVAEVVCYLDDNGNEVFNQITPKEKTIDVFVIEDYSRLHAYKIAFQVINFKYSGKGYDVRIYNKKGYIFNNQEEKQK
jgi:hypothetical protein